MLVLKVAFCISYNLLSNNANLEYLDAINAYDDEGGSHFGRCLTSQLIGETQCENFSIFLSFRILRKINFGKFRSAKIA